MDPHAHLDRCPFRPGVGIQCALPGGGGGGGVRRNAEHGKERITLGRKVGSVRSADGLTEDPVVLLEDVAPIVAEPPEELRRTLDVREEERDGAARKR